MQKSSWTNVYYDALDFFYYEPQHLGKIKNPLAQKKTLAEVRTGLAKTEVPLNHLLTFFLTLAPASLRNSLFREALPDVVNGADEQFHLVPLGIDELDKEYKLGQSVQPDFLFTGDQSTVSIEMKVDSKSDVQQVLKYALLALAVEQHEGGKEMSHSLIFLGKGGFSNLFTRKRFADPAALLAAASESKHDFLKDKPEALHSAERRFSEIVSTLSVGFVSYDALAVLLREQLGFLDTSPAAEVYRNLLSGLIGELENRRLCDGGAKP